MRGSAMPRIDDLIEQLRSIEQDLQGEYDERRAGFRFVLDHGRIRFSDG